MLRVARLVQILGELSRLSASCLAHADHDAVVADHGEEIVSDRVDWQVLPLFLDGLRLRELAHRFLLLALQSGCVLVSFSVVDLVGFVLLLKRNYSRLLFVLALDFQEVTHLGPGQIPKLVPHFVAVVHGSNVFENLAAFLDDLHEVAGGVFDHLHRLRLLCEHDPPIQKGWLDVMHHDHDSLLFHV